MAATLESVTDGTGLRLARDVLTADVIVIGPRGGHMGRISDLEMIAAPSAWTAARMVRARVRYISDALLNSECLWAPLGG